MCTSGSSSHGWTKSIQFRLGLMKKWANPGRGLMIYAIKARIMSRWGKAWKANGKDTRKHVRNGDSRFHGYYYHHEDLAGEDRDKELKLYGRVVMQIVFACYYCHAN
ncbi:hypothetical protein HanPI659440_Chr10g0396951 [Helianthus annuus]|nr:hypothetical protein HanPI659440_Chr10g0396951 [Helianthus annuus]